MIKVDNKKTIQKLAKNTFYTNRMRNLFAILAIVLTTVLFTGLFTIASSLITSVEESTMRQIGGNSHGSFKYLTKEQYERLKTHKSIKEITYSVVLGVAENEELRKYPSEIRYANDALEAETFFSFPTTGRLPEKENEIATNTIVLEQLGVPFEIGSPVTIVYTLGGKKHEETFTLVGYWEGDILMPANQIWLSRAYVEKQLKEFVPGEEDFVGIGKIFADVNFSNSFSIESKMRRVITESGYTTDDIAYGVNSAYMGNSDAFDVGMILGVSVVILMIVACGYLMISNVFTIGVAADIQYYGLLKTIGTTGTQIKRVMRKQVLWLCAMGVPVGIAAGCLVGAGLVPIVLSILNVNVVVVSMKPLVFVLAAFFAVVTVLISVSRPSRIAAKVSPIEALRQSDGVQHAGNALKKSKGISLWRMAAGNVFRNKQKLTLVTISLSLSLVILNAAYSMADSFDMDKFIKNFTSSDFLMADVALFNVYEIYSNDKETLNPAFLDTMRAMEGVEMFANVYFYEHGVIMDEELKSLPQKMEGVIEMEGWALDLFQESMTNGTAVQHTYGLDEDAWDEVEIIEGEIDQEKLATGNYVVVGAYDHEGRVFYYEVGDRIAIMNEKEEYQEYEVMAVVKFPYVMSVRHSHPITPEFYLPSDVFLKDIAVKAPMITVMDVEDDKEAAVESFLADYSEHMDSNMQYESKATIVAEYEQTQRTYRSVGTILSVLLALIGIMNFANTVITSIMTRRKELAVLQSIGMTGRQMEGMLVREGLLYILLAVGCALTAGSVLGYLGVSAMLSGSMVVTLKFSVFPAVVCVPLLVVVAAVVPYASQKVMCRKSVIERLREH